MSKGAFQISRTIFSSDIWNDIPKFRIFFYILGKAVFSEDGVMVAGIRLERGQYLRSMRGLQDDLAYKEGRGNAIKKYPLPTIHRKIKSLVNEGRIEVKSTEYGTLFTVVNYALYQGLSNYQNGSVEQQRNSYGTAMEQQWNNNKNDKNDKNDKDMSRSKLKFETHHLQLANLMYKEIKRNNPNAREPNLEDWANTFRLMMERDGREGKQIQDMILFSQRHNFWYKNILSASKLRKQFDRLLLEMNDNKKQTQVKQEQFRPDSVDLSGLYDEFMEGM